MWAQDQRSRDRQGEIESRLVWPPAQRESHQSQEQDENGQRQALAAARHSLEHVAERVDSGIRVDDLAVGRQRSADCPSADRVQIAKHWSKAESNDGHRPQRGDDSGKPGQCAPGPAGDEKHRYEEEQLGLGERQAGEDARPPEPAAGPGRVCGG